ncbi:MAG: serine hydrolase domain-containing protein [Steroidobacter sp.]
MTANGFDLGSLENERDMAARLSDAAIQSGCSNVSLGLLIRGRHCFVALDDRLRPIEDAAGQPVRAGCLAKPLTATLVATAVEEKQLDWAAHVSETVSLDGDCGRILSGISIRQLLNHTHGLDASALERMPRTDTGRLDISELCNQLAPLPISTPGRLHSYTNAGAWIAGALLESIYGKSYLQLLSEKRIADLKPGAAELHDDRVCPATGEALTLTLASWLLFLESHLHSHASLRADPVSLPGWSPTEQAACGGWKSYGSGWFGHNADLPESSALLRFNPEREVAIVLSSPGHGAFFALAMLFGALLPEFANLRPPRLLKPQECTQLELAAYAGAYSRSRDTVQVDATERGTLSFSMRGRSVEREIAPHALRAAEHRLFIPEPRDIPEFAFLQFVASSESQSFDYLWNGKQLWRRR